MQRPTQAIDLARKLSQRRPGDTNSWLTLARVLNRPEHFEECKTALERAIALSPRNGEAHDMLATIFADAKRFDEAFAACRPAAWGEQPPIFLRGRAAWVDARRGNLQQGIAALRKLIEEEPKYHWAITQLGEWYQYTRDYPAYREIAQRMVNLTPHRAAAHGTLGHACELLKDHAAAKAAYRRSIELDPAYRFGSMSLFDLELADKEYEASARTLNILRRQPDDGYAAAREVQLAARAGTTDRAVELFAKMCREVLLDPVPLQMAFKEIDKPTSHRLLERVLREACDAEPVNPAIGAIWATVECRHKAWRTTERLLEAIRGPDGNRAVALSAAPVVLKAMAKDYAARNPRHLLDKVWVRRRLERFIRKHDAWLHSDNVAWVDIAFCLVTIDRYEKAILWTDDWPKREPLQQSLLVNRIIALRHLGRDAQAIETARTAVTLADCNRHYLPKLVLALSDALNSDTEKAAERLRPLDFQKALASDRFLVELVEAAIEIGNLKSQPGVNAKKSITAVNRHLAKARRVWPQFRKNRFDKNAYLKVVRQLAAVRPTFWLKVWKVQQHVLASVGVR